MIGWIQNRPIASLETTGLKPPAVPLQLAHWAHSGNHHRLHNPVTWVIRRNLADSAPELHHSWARFEDSSAALHHVAALWTTEHTLLLPFSVFETANVFVSD